MPDTLDEFEELELNHETFGDDLDRNFDNSDDVDDNSSMFRDSNNYGILLEELKKKMKRLRI